MSGNRYRAIDPWHYRYLNANNATMAAADELINEPERHLMT
jgi:hypothetical protein